MATTEEGTETPDTPHEARTAVDFETAQRDLFEEVGLDTRSRFVDLENPQVRTHVFEAGPPSDDDPPLVFVHGAAAFGASLAPLMTQFDDTRTVAFDRPGYGLSDPFVYTEDNIQRTGVDVLEGVLDELEIDQADLVGNSAGGYTALLFALAHPNRVRRLITVGTILTFPGTHPPFPLRLVTVPLLNRLLQRLQKPGEEGVLDLMEIVGERDAIQNYPASIQALAAHGRDPKSAEAASSEFTALFSIRGWHSSIRISEDDLRNLQQPTTVIWGDHDPFGGPNAVRDGIELIPDVRFETVDSGHIVYLAHPERCAQLIRRA